MKILTKKLGRAEVMCRCIIIPRDKKALFPVPGVQFDIHEGKATYEGKIDKQYRLRSISWFRQHRAIKAGDEVTFFKEDGAIRISLSRSFSKPENETFDWAHEVLNAIRDREIHGIVRIDGNGFSVEIGEHVEQTQIVFTRV